MKPEYSVVEAHYENMTAYRVVKQQANDRLLTTVHVYTERSIADNVADFLNDKLGA